MLSRCPSFFFRTSLLCLSLFCASLNWATITVAADPFPEASLPGVDIGGELGMYYETSGIVWHTRLERFFTVDDGNGKLSSLDTNGGDVVHWTVGYDLEGITVADPITDLVYVGREHINDIVEYDFVTGETKRTFDLSTWMTTPGGSGLESLTFVTDSDNPEGGLFYAGQQSDGIIYAFRLPIVSSTTSTDVSLEFSFQAAEGRTDLSGMHYDRVNDVLYAIWDANNFIRAMRPDGTFLQEWTLPGSRQEGITFQGDNLLVSQDNGPVIRYASFPLVGPPLVLGDGNGDGKVDHVDYDIWVAAYRNNGELDPLGSPESGDFNDDGHIDGLDYIVWAGNFGTGPNDATAVPEPGTLATTVLALVGLLAAPRYRRR